MSPVISVVLSLGLQLKDIEKQISQLQEKGKGKDLDRRRIPFRSFISLFFTFLFSLLLSLATIHLMLIFLSKRPQESKKVVLGI